MVKPPCADRVSLVEHPAESLAVRIHMLDEAKETIDVSYYAMHMGESTDLFLGALLDAADRGVHVRVLVDGLFGGLTYQHPVYAAAIGTHPNMELKIYNTPKILRPWTWNGRLHDKYIVIDNRLLLMGGRNIGDKYFGTEGYRKQLSYDRDVLVYNTAWRENDRSSVLFDVKAYMDSLWDGKDVCAPFSGEKRCGSQKRQKLRSTYARYRAEHPELFDHEADNYEAATYAANRVTFFHNDIQTGAKEPKVGYVLEQLLSNARESVLLQSPYIILDKKLKNLFNCLSEKEIDTGILTNSIYSSPNPVAYTAYACDRKTILKTVDRLWEYQGGNSLHAKTYLIDDRMVVIGSYNLDPRSAYIDTEIMMAIDSPDFMRHMRRVQEEYQAESLRVGRDGTYPENTAMGTAKAPIGKRIVAGLVFLPVQLFKHLT